MLTLTRCSLGLTLAIPSNEFWGSFMPSQAAGAACAYIATRGGAALGALGGGAIGASLSAGSGAAVGATVGSYLGGAGGAALAAAFCPGQPPGVGQAPLTPPPRPFEGGQCPTTYLLTASYSYDNTASGGSSGTSETHGGSPVQGPFTGMVKRPAGSFTDHVITGPNVGSGVVAASVPNSFQNVVVSVQFARADNLPDNCGNLPGYDNIHGPGSDVPPIADDPAARTPINIDVDFGGNIIPVVGVLQLIGANFENGAFQLNFDLGGLSFNYNPLNGDINIGGGDGGAGDDGDGDNVEQLSGLFYNVTAIGNSQQHSAIGDSTFFYPRFWSVQFTSGDARSDFLQLNAEKGFVENPLPQFFDSFVFVPYRPGNTASFQKHFEKVCCPQDNE